MLIDYNGSMEVDIKPEEDYNLKQVHDRGLIPWARHYATLRQIIRDDTEGSNTLKARWSGKDQRTRYTIKGSNLIKYLKDASPHLMRFVRKTKQTCQKKKN